MAKLDGLPSGPSAISKMAWQAQHKLKLHEQFLMRQQEACLLFDRLHVVLAQSRLWYACCEQLKQEFDFHKFTSGAADIWGGVWNSTRALWTHQCCRLSS